MGWIARDYACQAPECGYTAPEIVDKAAEPDTMECLECGGERIKTFGFPAHKRMTYLRSHKDHDALRRQVDARKIKRAEQHAAVKKANKYNNENP